MACSAKMAVISMVGYFAFVVDASCSIIDRNHVLNNQSPAKGLAVSLVMMNSAAKVTPKINVDGKRLKACEKPGLALCLNASKRTPKTA
jgi:hypothetical protein